MVFIGIQYPKYSNEWYIIFEWHMWMFIFNTPKLHHNNCMDLIKM